MSAVKRYSFWPQIVHLPGGGGVRAEVHFKVEEDGLFVAHQDYARLKADVERLRKMSIDPAQVKKLVEDGVQDRPYHYTVKYTVEVSRDAYLRLLDVMTAYWNAAKEGKPSV